jgi:arylsulfatase A-like enzyme
VTEPGAGSTFTFEGGALPIPLDTYKDTIGYEPRRTLSGSPGLRYGMDESGRIRQALIAVGFCLLGCGAEELPPPNVVLLVLDTVRADHVSCYGYAKNTTPHLDALAEESVRYSGCRATGPWTLPSHASMFTGRFPFQHRADSLVNDQGVWRELPLKEEHTTLAESLSKIGYRTGAFVANTAYLREAFQLNQGFDEYVVKREPGVEKNVEAFEFVDNGVGPFFLFMNYMDAHRPYNDTRLDEDRMAELECSGNRPSAKMLDRMYKIVLEQGKEAPPKLVESVTRCYDLGIANADLAVGNVVESLRSRGLLDNTLLIVTSDHGEFLGEHGLVEHSKDIYEEVLHVPLVCKHPRRPDVEAPAGTVDDRLISLADLPRLVARALPPEYGTGMLADYPLPVERDFNMAEVSISRERDMRASYGARFRRKRFVYYADGHKLIRSTDGQHELYNLQIDPDETVNLYSTEPDLAKDLTARMEEYVESHPAEYRAADAPEFNAAMMQELEKLGYAGTSSDEDEEEEEQ